jgi:hypothetical protein
MNLNGKEENRRPRDEYIAAVRQTFKTLQGAATTAEE